MGPEVDIVPNTNGAGRDLHSLGREPDRRARIDLWHQGRIGSQATPQIVEELECLFTHDPVRPALESDGD